ncbi:YqiA/YcfP family alpha/beta fold hydrolase [Methylotetracoccus oryzae]|uniref:YqiA/YcfP family alpha/beta fold hydrolase n=1 Tax=Methylotetracoccus oryzae TaxID=1919059 RepID=UPI0011191987|nr:YqiA/YcfP family alpha/beta fold hydrolase [Methylotetracoccus oryzae]
MIIYLHGFRSAPASAKARLLAQRMAERGLEHRFWCEQLAFSPREAIAQVEAVLDDCPQDATLVGSSLGGYYATYLAEKYDLQAVLVNPAVVAHIALARYLGPQDNLYTGETFVFTQEHIAELTELDVPALTKPERFWLLVETGDELLDYRQAVARYAGAAQTVLEGGDHSFTRFGEFIEPIIAFAGLDGVPTPLSSGH